MTKQSIPMRKTALPKDGNVKDIIALVHVKYTFDEDDFAIAQGSWHGDGYSISFIDVYGNMRTIDMPYSGLYTSPTDKKIAMVCVREFYPIEVTWATHATVRIVNETAYMDDNYLEE